MTLTLTAPTPVRCCTSHGERCTHSATCCERCTEARHPAHSDGSPCAQLPRMRREAQRFLADAAAPPRARDGWWW